MAITKNVTVTQVDRPKTGDKYPRYTVHYTGDDGSTWKIGNLGSNLSPDVIEQLTTATVPIEKSITVEKEGKFWNLISVGVVTEKKEYKKSGSTYNKSSYKAQDPAARKETDTRIQVMNALTNSIVSLGAGATMKQIETRVVELVLLGNDVTQRALNGELAAQQEDAVPQDDIVEELGF